MGFNLSGLLGPLLTEASTAAGTYQQGQANTANQQTQTLLMLNQLKQQQNEQALKNWLMLQQGNEADALSRYHQWQTGTPGTPGVVDPGQRLGPSEPDVNAPASPTPAPSNLPPSQVPLPPPAWLKAPTPGVLPGAIQQEITRAALVPPRVVTPQERAAARANELIAQGMDPQKASDQARRENALPVGAAPGAAAAANAPVEAERQRVASWRSTYAGEIGKLTAAQANPLTGIKGPGMALADAKRQAAALATAAYGAPPPDIAADLQGGSDPRIADWTAKIKAKVPGFTLQNAKAAIGHPGGITQAQYDQLVAASGGTP